MTEAQGDEIIALLTLLAEMSARLVEVAQVGVFFFLVMGVGWVLYSRLVKGRSRV